MSKSSRVSRFGPSALATPANLISFARILLTVPLLALIVAWGPSWGALALWVALAGSDGLDGYLARRQGTTRSGAFIDPLADKILVLGAMAALVATGVLWWFPVAVIAVRELGIQGLRSWWARQGVTVPARFGAKVKTWVQAFAVGVALLPPAAEHAPGLATAVLWLAVAFTVVTGAQYLLEGHKARSTTPHRQ